MGVIVESDRLWVKKTIVLIGAWQVGKTTLVQEILKDRAFLFLDGEDPLVRQQLTNPNTKQIETLIGSYKIIFYRRSPRD